MGKRGPAPKPSAQKKLEGTFRPDRAARNELVAPAEAPAMPKGLGTVAIAKWNELLAILLERGTISREDGVLLEQFCRFYAQWLRYEAIAEKKPMISVPLYGDKVNPATDVAVKLEQRLTALGDRLGLSASARSKVSVPEKKKDEDPTEAFLFGKPKLVKPA